MSVRPLVALVRKDLQLYLSDRRAVILSFLAPILLASLFASMTSGRGEGDDPIRVALKVVDLDGSQLADAVIKAIERDENLETEELTLDAARQAIRKGDAVAAVVLPQGFGEEAGRALFGGEPPEVRFLHDPTRAMELGLVQGLVARHLYRSVSQEIFGGQSSTRLIDDALGNLDRSERLSTAEKLALGTMLRGVRDWNARRSEASQGSGADGFGFDGLREPFLMAAEPVLSGGQTAGVAMSAHAFAGMSVQFILFSSIESAVALLNERQKGLWRRLRAAPLSRSMLLLSKAISGALIALMILAVLYVYGGLFFGIRVQGSWPGFVLVGAGYALTAATFGLLIAALGKTPQAARGVSVLAVLLMVLLGGAWFPSFLFPDWLRLISLAVPTRWAILGFEGATTRGMSFAEMLGPIAVLLAFAVGFGLVAFARFEWEER